VSNEENDLKKLAADNELLSRRVRELELALENVQQAMAPSIKPTKKLDLSLVAFIRMAFLPLAGGLVRAIYKGFYRMK
jgi:hypothetical protein